MNINKNWLKDEEGNLLAPRTLTSAIQDEDGNSFQEYADNMVVMSPEETTEIPEDLTGCITNKDIQNIVSDAYDSNKTYAVGDYCIYNNVAYKCTTATDIAEEFDSAKWTATRIGTEVSELNNKLTELGTIYKNKLAGEQSISYNTVFNAITIPAGTYIVTMSIRQSGTQSAMAWLEVNGVTQLESNEYFMLCGCDGVNTPSSVSKVMVFENENTLKMRNGSGVDYYITYAELSACRLN